MNLYTHRFFLFLFHGAFANQPMRFREKRAVNHVFKIA